MKTAGYLPNILLYAILIAAILFPRALALDRVVTPDEPTWLTTSANFYHALAHGHLDQTYQIEHPGVTTMWVGTLAFLWRFPQYASQGPGQIAWWQEEVGPYLKARGYEPLEILKTSRLIMALVITGVLLAAFHNASRLFGPYPSFFGFLLIATDPFHIAHSRILHQDGLLSSLMLLSVLALLNFLLRGARRSSLILSGAAAGLAWLTKSPTLFLIPFAFLLIGITLLAKKRVDGISLRRLSREDIFWAAKSLILWGAAGLAVFVLLWPAMWVTPIESVWRVLRATVGYAAGGHEAPIYFNGVIIDGDPGASFYPLNYVWRATPFVLAGLGLALVSLAVPHLRRLDSKQRAPLAAMLLFTVLFTIFMSLGAKKFDRYLLPVFAPLDLIAALGWAALLRWISIRPSFAAAGGLAIALLFMAGQVQGLVSAYPYYFSYYNPLLGGAKRAPEVMMVGWGEGLDQAARYLNQRPGSPKLRVASGVWNGTFSYFFRGQIERGPFLADTGSETGWDSSDYCIVYINELQRNRLPQALLNRLSHLTPVLVVQLQGLDYVRVYDIRGVPPPVFSQQK